MENRNQRIFEACEQYTYHPSSLNVLTGGTNLLGTDLGKSPSTRRVGNRVTYDGPFLLFKGFELGARRNK